MNSLVCQKSAKQLIYTFNTLQSSSLSFIQSQTTNPHICTNLQIISDYFDGNLPVKRGISLTFYLRRRRRSFDRTSKSPASSLVIIRTESTSLTRRPSPIGVSLPIDGRESSLTSRGKGKEVACCLKEKGEEEQVIKREI